MEKYKTTSVDETEQIGYNFGKSLKGGEVIAFSGELGAGKTAFTRGIARGIGYSGEVTSPTFTIMHIYNGDHILCHFDMYRISTIDDLYTTGYFDCLDNNEIIVIEWSENISFALPQNVISINLSYGAAENERIIEIEEIK